MIMPTVAVIGLGYVGLPLSLQFAQNGIRVIGLDVDETKITTLQAGQTYIKHVSANRIGATIDKGTFIPSADMSRVSEAEAVILCVPTPLTKQREPDLSYVLNTGRAIAPHLQDVRKVGFALFRERSWHTQNNGLSFRNPRHVRGGNERAFVNGGPDPVG